MHPPFHKASPRRVNPFLHQEDFDALYYSCQGNKSARYIAQITGLTEYQVTYRRLKQGIRVTRIRNGLFEPDSGSDFERAIARFSESMDRMGRDVFNAKVLPQLRAQYKTPPMPRTEPPKKHA